jgi:predicted metalloendopeptidase
MSWATIWRSKARDAAIKNQVKQIHTLQECTVRMCRYKMWIPTKRLTKGDGISPENRVKIW